MNKELYKVAAKACSDVYEINTDLGTTEFHHTIKTIHGRRWQVLSIAGTNETLDWLKNFNLLSWQGIKLPAYKAAHKINDKIKHKLKRFEHLPLLVTGHSKAGATAIAFKRLFGANYCVAFAPARSLRPWAELKMSSTTIFIDPDDLVSRLAFISFEHPICRVFKARENHFFFSFEDHCMDNWVEFVNKMID